MGGGGQLQAYFRDGPFFVSVNCDLLKNCPLNLD